MKRNGNANGANKVVYILFLLFPLLFFPSGSSGYVHGDVDGDGKISLTEAIHALQVVSESRSALSSKTINVPADIPTIQQAIDAAEEGDTIYIAAGTYNENISIIKDHIKLQGAAKETTIIDGGAQDVIGVQGGMGVIIKALMVRNGKEGIYGGGGAVFEVNDVIVQDCSSAGIRLSASTAQITDSTVLRSGADGIFAMENSSVIFAGTVTASYNTTQGFYFINTSSGSFYGATITSSSNGGFGILVANNSSLTSTNSTVTMQSNTRDGAMIFGSSALDINTGTWVSEGNTQRGLAVISASTMFLRTTSSLTSRQNKHFGIFIVENSNAEMWGTLLSEDNVSVGLNIDTSSSVQAFMPGSLTVRGTKGGLGTGIFLQENSLLKSSGPLLVENNKDGSLNCGIYVCRNSTITLFPHPSADVTIQNNQGYGIALHLNSVGRFDPTVSINTNKNHGLRLVANSVLDAAGMIITSNEASGIFATDGSVVRCVNCTITGNLNNDVNLEWASRSLLTGGTVGSVVCADGTVLSGGDHICP